MIRNTRMHGAVGLVILLVISLLVAGAASVVGYTMYEQTDDLKTALEEAQEAVPEKDQEIADLKERLRSGTGASEIAARRIESARDDLDARRKEINDLKEEKFDLKREKREIERENSELKEKNADFKADLKSRDAELDSLKQKKSFLEGESASLKRESDRLKTELTALEKEYEAIESAPEKYSGGEAVEKLKEELKEKKSRLSDLNGTIERLDVTLADRNGTIKGLTERLAARDKTIEKQEAKLESNDEKIESLGKDLYASKLSVVKKEGEISNLQNLLNSKTDDKSRDLIAMRDKNIEKLETRLAASEGEVKSLEKDLNASNLAVIRKDGEISRMKDLLASKTGDTSRELIAMRDKSIEKLEARLSVSEENVKLLEKDLNASNLAAVRKDAEISNMKNLLDSKTDDTSKELIAMRDKSIEKLEAKLSASEEKMKLVEKELNAVNLSVVKKDGEISRMNDALKSSADDKDRIIADLQEELKKKDDDIEVVRKSVPKGADPWELQQAKTGIKEKEDQITELEESLAGVQKTVEQLEADRDAIAEEKTALKLNLDDLKDRVKEPETDKQPEFIRAFAGLFHTNAYLAPRASTSTLPATRFNPERLTDMTSDAEVPAGRIVALGRHGFMLDYTLHWTRGVKTMLDDGNFADIVFEAGHEIDADFMLHQVTGSLIFGLGAIRKTTYDRADLSLCIGWHYAALYASLADNDDAESVEKTISAGMPILGLRVDYMVQKNFWASMQVLGSWYDYDKYHLHIYIEPNLNLNISLSKNVEFQLGYRFSLLRFERDDVDKGTLLEINYRADGPVVGLVARF